MGFEWDEDLSTGIADIDSQHRELITRLNLLLETSKIQKDQDTVGKYLDFLSEYVDLHFATEEREMTNCNYPGYAEHVAEHRLFKTQVGKLYESYAKHGANIQVFVMTIRASGDWLVNHIHKTDKIMAAFLKKQH